MIISPLVIATERGYDEIVVIVKEEEQRRRETESGVEASRTITPRWISRLT